MSAEESRERQFEWLRSEQDLVNDRMSAYSEADQKIFAVVATLVVGIVGLASSKFADVSASKIPYVLFLSSVLMTAVLIQSSLYSSLILLFAERKVRLCDKISSILSCDPNLAESRYAFLDYSSFDAYKSNVIPYYVVRSSIGLLLSLAGLCVEGAQYEDWRFVVGFLVSLGFALAGAWGTVVHLQAIKQFEADLKACRRSRIDEPGHGAEAAASARA